MQARTIGHISAADRSNTCAAASSGWPHPRSSGPGGNGAQRTQAVDLEALSDEDIDRLLDGGADAGKTAPEARACETVAKPTDKRALLRQWLQSGEARIEPLTLPQRGIVGGVAGACGRRVEPHLAALHQRARRSWIDGAQELRDGGAAGGGRRQESSAAFDPAGQVTGPCR